MNGFPDLFILIFTQKNNKDVQLSY